MPNKNNKKQNKKRQTNAQAVGRVVGQGGYYSDQVAPFMRKLVPTGSFQRIGNAGGTTLGAMSNVPGASIAGGYLGGKLGSGIARILGFGDYSVSANTLSHTGGQLSEGTPIPSFVNRGHETRVCHREYITDVVVPSSATVFSNTAYTINPGDSTTFPWLSPIAAQFQQYKINGMVFEFKTLSSDITAGGALGSVVLATDYDVNGVPYPNKSVMENSEYAVSCKPSLSQIHAIECDPKLTSVPIKYVRDSDQSLSATSDNRMYDHGKFQLATVGLPGSAATVLGELWVSYDISLYKPDITVTSGVSKVVSAAGVSKTAYMGSAPVVTGNAGITALSNTVTFSIAGTYYVNMQVTGTVLGTPTISGSATATVVLIAAGTNLTNHMIAYTITATAGQTFILDWSSTSTTVTNSGLHIIRTPITTF